MPKIETKQSIGRLGEDIAKIYLENKGYLVIDLNYRKKYGEIDIIANKGQKVHFIEIKSVSRETINGLDKVSHETGQHRPEENVHEYKLRRLARTIQVYLLEKYQSSEPEWVFDVITVEIDIKHRKSRVNFIENLVL